MATLYAQMSHPLPFPTPPDTYLPNQSFNEPPPFPTMTSPASPTRTNDSLNLTVLQRHLPTTKSIDFIVPYAVVYIFSRKREGWEKSGIEGSLFVVRTHDISQQQQQTSKGEEEDTDGYAIVVLNRRGLENFILQLRTSEEVEITEQYIIVQDTAPPALLPTATPSFANGPKPSSDDTSSEPKIYGLWIFEEVGESTEGTRQMCGDVIMDRARRVELVREEQKEVSVAQSNEQVDGPAAAGSGPDLMALLNGKREKGVEPLAAGVGSGQRGLQPGQVNLLDLFKKAGAS